MRRAVANRLTDRPNLAGATGERWRPPLHASPDTVVNRWIARVRRIFDLQAGSLWRDLSTQLPKARGVVLDVGCGAQPYRPLIDAEARYVGIDTEDAKAHFGYEVPDAIYFAGDRWPIEDASVDVVLCAETLEHVLEPATLLAEAHRCLRTGGDLLLTVPFSARWHFVPHDYWRFTPSSLEHLLREAGFVDIAVYARGNAVTVACYKLMALLLPWLFPQSKGRRTRFVQVLAFLTAPFVAIIALIGRASLLSEGGDDCLGYTVTASRL